jgi:AmmeMemoRadiSam system protein A
MNQGNLLSAYLFPHPPIIVPEIGMGEEKKASNTIGGCEIAAKRIKEEKPDTIVIITPHGPVFSDAVSISINSELIGSFKNFGRPDVALKYQNDLEIIDLIIKEWEKNRLPFVQINTELSKRFGISTELDHGALVPLYYVEKEINNIKIVHITIGFLSYEELFTFGECINKAIKESGKKVVILTSGDLSHKLSYSSPAGYSPRGKQFDEMLVSQLSKGEFTQIMHLDEDLIEEAGECGLRPITMMLGAISEYQSQTEIFSYEGPFGVGYCVAKIRLNAEREEYYMNPYIKLAKIALETYVREGKVIDVPDFVTDEMLSMQAGVFVSLKRKRDLRGCIGTIASTTKSVAHEIIQNAISAGTGDPRFYPVQSVELSDIQYSVDILMPAEKIKSIDELDAHKYGVIVRSRGRSGLLLPDLEGVDTPEEQVSIALRKAGIDRSDDYTLQRFEVVRHGEH